MDVDVGGLKVDVDVDVDVRVMVHAFVPVCVCVHDVSHDFHHPHLPDFPYAPPGNIPNRIPFNRPIPF